MELVIYILMFLGLFKVFELLKAFFGLFRKAGERP